MSSTQRAINYLMGMYSASTNRTLGSAWELSCASVPPEDVVCEILRVVGLKCFGAVRHTFCYNETPPGPEFGGRAVVIRQCCAGLDNDAATHKPVVVVFDGPDGYGKWSAPLFSGMPGFNESHRVPLVKPEFPHGMVSCGFIKHVRDYYVVVNLSRRAIVSNPYAGCSPNETLGWFTLWLLGYFSAEVVGNVVPQNVQPGARIANATHDVSHDAAALKSVMHEVKELKAQVAEGMNIRASIDELRLAICQISDQRCSLDQRSGIRKIIGL